MNDVILWMYVSDVALTIKIAVIAVVVVAFVFAFLTAMAWSDYGVKYKQPCLVSCTILLVAVVIACAIPSSRTMNTIVAAKAASVVATEISSSPLAQKALRAVEKQLDAYINKQENIKEKQQ